MEKTVISKITWRLMPFLGILYLIAYIGNLGGFIAQNVVPWIKDATGSTIAPMFFLAACLTAAGLLVIMTARITARRAAREGTSLA